MPGITCTALEDAKLIHRQPRATWAAGRQDDEITIVWPTFHAPDIDSIPADLSTIPADLSDQPAESAGSFNRTKNYKNDYNNTDDVVVTTPSGENQGKGSTRSKGTARSGPSARATTRAKDDSPVDGFASVEEYVLDLERCAGALEVRLFSEDDGQIDVPVLARKLRGLCIRYEFACLWSDILRAIPVGHTWWWQAGQKEVPVGYLLRLIELDMIQQQKEREADDDGLEARFLALFEGVAYVSGTRIASTLLPDVAADVMFALTNRLLAEGRIVKISSPPNSYKLAS